ncbi:MAG: hypothetical protein ACXWV4_05410, partial [Flavitalea sp.]
MKKLIPFLILISFSIYANAQIKKFVRIYDSDGKKINKGLVVGTNDSSLQLLKNKDTLNLPISSFSSIKTKRSAGNNVLIGTFIGAGTFSVLGAASADEDAFFAYSAGNGAAAGALLGAPFGAAIGGITALFKKSRKFTINGNPDQWKAFQSYFD